MQVNKDTKIFGSFSTNPGNNGSLYFNGKFSENNINAIYKPFKVVDIQAAILSSKTLNFSGFALSMPFKVDCIAYLDSLDSHAKAINAVNTVLNLSNKLVGYNTDWLGVKKYFTLKNIDSLSIIGEGGFSKAVQYCCKNQGMKFEVFNRLNINNIGKAKYTLFNATPVDFKCDVDGRPHTEAGKEIALLQAQEQYELYKSVL